MALGLLPRDLGEPQVILDGRRTADAVVDVLEQHSLSEEV